MVLTNMKRRCDLQPAQSLAQCPCVGVTNQAQSDHTHRKHVRRIGSTEAFHLRADLHRHTATLSQRQQGEFIDVSRSAVASLSLGKKI